MSVELVEWKSKKMKSKYRGERTNERYHICYLIRSIIEPESGTEK